MANRFWVTQPVSGAVVSVSSPPQVRLTVSSTTGMTTGDVRTVAGIVGTTEANGTWTITVIDATHIDLQGTTFTNVYTSGGSVNGKWDATNANNWVSSSGGTNYGQTVPGSGDAVTFDGSSGGGTVTPNATINVTSITAGAFTGTLAFNTNNNNVTAQTVSFTGNATRTINMGSGTWTLTGTSGTPFDCTTTTGLTPTFNNCAIIYSGNAATRIFSGGGQTYGSLTINDNSTTGAVNILGTNTFSSLTVGSGTTITPPQGGTTTISGALTITGTSVSQSGLISSGPATGAATISVGSASALAWCGLCRMTKAGAGSITATNSFDMGGNTGVTITVPSGGGGQRVIGAG